MPSGTPGTQSAKEAVELPVRFDADVLEQLDGFIAASASEERPSRQAVIQKALRSYLVSAQSALPTDATPERLTDIPPEYRAIVEELLLLLDDSTGKYRAFREVLLGVISDWREERKLTDRDLVAK